MEKPSVDPFTQNRNFRKGKLSRTKPNVVLLQSYLNIFNVRQVTLGAIDKSILLFNVPVKAVEDSDVLQKVFYFYIAFQNNVLFAF